MYKRRPKIGEWKAQCERSGFICRSDDLLLQWDGRRVHRDFIEARHPQEFAKVVPDNQGAPWTRPLSWSDTLTSVGTITNLGGGQFFIEFPGIIPSSPPSVTIGGIIYEVIASTPTTVTITVNGSTDPLTGDQPVIIEPDAYSTPVITVVTAAQVGSSTALYKITIDKPLGALSIGLGDKIRITNGVKTWDAWYLYTDGTYLFMNGAQSSGGSTIWDAGVGGSMTKLLDGVALADHMSQIVQIDALPLDQADVTCSGDLTNILAGSLASYLFAFGTTSFGTNDIGQWLSSYTAFKIKVQLSAPATTETPTSGWLVRVYYLS